MSAALPPMNERIRTYIDARSVSRKRVAINMGITESKLSLILNGKRRLSVDEYEAMCNAMAVDPKAFYDSGQTDNNQTD